MVLDIESPNSPNQKKFCELITGIDIKAQNKLIDAFKECYSTKSSSEAKIAENALKMAKLYQPYNEAIQSGKTPVSQLEIARLVEIEEKVRQHKLAEKLIYGKGVSEYEVY
jgi:hypothetical protein